MKYLFLLLALGLSNGLMAQDEEPMNIDDFKQKLIGNWVLVKAENTKTGKVTNYQNGKDMLIVSTTETSPRYVIGYIYKPVGGNIIAGEHKIVAPNFCFQQILRAKNVDAVVITESTLEYTAYVEGANAFVKYYWSKMED